MATAAGEGAANGNGTTEHDDDVTDAEIISPGTVNTSENKAGMPPADSAASPTGAANPVDASAADEAEKPRKQG